MSSYIDDKNDSGGDLDGGPVIWELKTWERLNWLYGEDRADRISVGQDPKTQADLARWRALGRRSAA